MLLKPPHTGPLLPALARTCLIPFAVSGPGAYGGLQAPAEDDTGVRPGSGTSGQHADAATGLAGASVSSQAQRQPGKVAFLQQHYGEAAGTEASVEAGGGDGQPHEGIAAKQQADQLTLIDDDA